VLVGVLYLGLEDGVSQTAMQPNQGIHRSARHGVLVGVVAGLLFGVVQARVLQVGRVVEGLPVGGWAAVLLGVLGGVMGFAVAGVAVVEHYTLRLLLFWSKASPQRYVRFLEAAVDGLLLRRVGGGYRFPHRLLQERFMTYLPATPTAPMLTQPSQRPREAIKAP
jgi:hypothetical protein